MPTHFLDQLTIDPVHVPLYEKIKKDQNPILIWGCGNVAENVYHYCQTFNIAIVGCFVNVESRQSEFKGFDVLSMDAVIAQFPRFSVIIGHANYAEGTAFLRTIKNVSAIYCVTSCVYDIWAPICIEFLEKEAFVLNRLYDELEDEMSKLCMTAYFDSRINDKAEFVFPFIQEKMNYYSNDVITLTENEVLLDVGAWEGTAIWSFIDAVKGNYHHIIALEPDKRCYRTLRTDIESRSVKSITTKMVCAYSKDGMVKFEVDPTDEQMGGISEFAETFQMCPAIKIDSLCEELRPDVEISIIKINFPFSVEEVLMGAANLLGQKRPKLIVRVGFDETVLLKTYEVLKKINPFYKLYFRYTVGMPQGLTLFAV